MEICPVCNTEVETGEPYETDYLDEEKQAPTVSRDGVTYYFCDEDHRETFEADPDEYLS